MSAAAYQAVNLSPVPESAAVAAARRVLRTESEALSALAEALDGTFERFIEQLAAARGRVVVTGMGKSGHIGRKIAATLASTGTPALYVHPAEASHGDLGMLTAQDVVLALSNSGETPELADIVAYSRRFAIPLLAIVGRKPSSLAETADLALVLPKRPEACPMGLAPTTSTTSMLALGDALAVALLERRGFGSQDFGLLHPGGKLGTLLKTVRDIMHSGQTMPLMPLGTRMSDAILEMTTKGFGCVGIVDGRGLLTGIITDGDLRRHMRNDLLDARVDDVMTRSPKSVRPDQLLSETLDILNSMKVTALFAVETGKPVGIIHVHDLLRTGAA
jgi:arabinose-5-phosphate isomerase